MSRRKKRDRTVFGGAGALRPFTRRGMLRGIGGATLALPLMESWPISSTANAQAEQAAPFAVFFRQSSGVASAQTSKFLGAEPERFWPRETGALTSDNVAGRATDELEAYLQRTLLLKVNKHHYRQYADGHANGAQQGLTARGPTPETQGNSGKTEANGPSIDYRIASELNSGGSDPLYLYTGAQFGWLGGACLSYRAAGERVAALRNPFLAYKAITGGLTEAPTAAEAESNRALSRSVNDVVREQLQSVLSSSLLSGSDRQRLDLHLTSVRETEVAVGCLLTKQAADTLAAESRNFARLQHDHIIATTRAHLRVAALAVSCGYTRAATVQVGSGNSSSLQFAHPETGELLNNYHFISHRVESNGGNGTVIQGSDLLHHYIDRYHGQMFRSLLDLLDEYKSPEGGSLLDSGLAVWFNDNGDGPAHNIKKVPYALVGSCGGRLKQGQYLELSGSENLRQVLNSIGTAVGLTGGSPGEPLTDFGDPALTGGIRGEMFA